MLTTQRIGERIGEARKKIGVSQAGLAGRLFISAQAVGKWERGESLPDILMLNRLAEMLNVNLNYFSEGSASATERIPVELPEKQADESTASDERQWPSGKAGKTPKWDMSRGNWVDADFSGLKNLHEKFSSSNMQRCLFIGSDLSGLLLSGNHVDSCDFSGCDISGSRIQRSHFSKDQFKDCTLNAAEFSGSYVTGCDFSGADLTGVTMKSGGFEKNTVTDTVWNRTAFTDTYLADIAFEGAIEDCSFENCSFKRVTFREATLRNTFFKNKSLKGIRFIDCQADRMTYEFLKNGKADVSGITVLTA